MNLTTNQHGNIRRAIDAVITSIKLPSINQPYAIEKAIISKYICSKLNTWGK